MGKLCTLRNLIDSLPTFGDRPAVLALLQEDSVCWSYADLADHVHRLAVGLSTVGVGRGDTVALLAGNRPEWIVAALAVIKAGAVVVPLDVQLGDEGLAYILKNSQARFIFTTTDQAGRLEWLAANLELTPILLDAGSRDNRSWRGFLRDTPLTLASVEPDDLAVLFYTSGTTGPPKGVPLSHANLAFQLNTVLATDIVAEDDRLLLPLPLHHVYPFVLGMLAPLVFGLPIIMPQALTGPQIVRAVREGRVTLMIGVPRLYRALYAGITAQAESGNRMAALWFKANAGLSLGLRRRLGLRWGKLLLRPLHQRIGPTLHILACGGAKLDPDLAWQLEGLGWQVLEGYGLTETAPLLTMNTRRQARIGSPGRPIAGVELCLDPAAQPAGVVPLVKDLTGTFQVEGEILARGPNVFSGYWRLPEETRQAFTAEGWFRTGDLGYFDRDSYLYITGRVSTVIVTASGKNIQPEAVETAYEEHPLIREIGVLQRDGQLVGLIVPELNEIRQRGYQEIAPAIREAVQERSKKLPSYQRLSDYAITRDALARTRLGKIRRHLLSDRYDQVKRSEQGLDTRAARPISSAEMSTTDRALLEDVAAKQVWQWLVSRYADQRLTPDTSPQLDLGIDSLEWLNLTLEIRQRAGVELSEAAISRIDTIRDLLQEVSQAANVSEVAAQSLLLEQPEAVLNAQQKGWLEPLDPIRSALARGMYGLNRLLLRTLFRLRVQGLEHLPQQPPFVLAPNHVSFLDPPAVAAALNYRCLCQTYWAGATAVIRHNPLIYGISRLAQTVPIDPDQAVATSLAFGAAVLKRQKILVWFPEGRRSLTGELEPFKPGLGLLLQHFHVPVVPVFIHGTREALPVGQTIPRLKQITIVFGEPLNPGELERQGQGKQPHERIIQALHDRVAELGAHQETVQ